MQRRLFALAATVSLSFAFALSPAQTAYDQAKQLLIQRYGGLSKADRNQIVEDGQKQLDAACADTGESCAFDEAYKVIAKSVAALNDGHSYFEPPKAYQDFLTRSRGGSQLQYGVKLLGDNRDVVNETVPGSAAADVGLKRGDRLLRIDGQPYSFDLLQETKARGLPVRLDLQRGDAPLSLTITARESSTRDLPRVEYVGDVAVIRIPTFNAGGGVGQGTHDLIRDAKARGARAVIVDLRGNPGGSLTECDMAISAFVPQFERVAKMANGDDPILVRNGGYQDNGRFYPSVRNPALWEGPLAVLVDERSASCSEFFAREIQFARRGTIIGEPTAGVSNTATLVFPLAGGAAIHLTTVYYAKPDGTAYPERIVPDVAADDDVDQLVRGNDVMLERGLGIVRTAAASALPTGK